MLNPFVYGPLSRMVADQDHQLGLMMKGCSYLFVDEDMEIEEEEISLVHLHLQGILPNPSLAFPFSAMAASRPYLQPSEHSRPLGRDLTALNSH